MRQVFASDSIRYVEVTEALLPDYLAMVNDIARVARFIGRRAEPIPEEEERAWVRGKRAENAPIFSMLEKATGAFIGNVELMDVCGGEAELGIAVTAGMQDRGFGKEAVQAIAAWGRDRLGLKRIALKVYPENARAIHVYEQCGFREYARTDADICMELTL